jgi:hypothetical protein
MERQRQRQKVGENRRGLMVGDRRRVGKDQREARREGPKAAKRHPRPHTKAIPLDTHTHRQREREGRERECVCVETQGRDIGSQTVWRRQPSATPTVCEPMSLGERGSVCVCGDTRAGEREGHSFTDGLATLRWRSGRSLSL